MKMTIFWRNKKRTYAVEELNFRLGNTNFCVTSSPQTILPGKTILEEFAINDDTTNDRDRVLDLTCSELFSMEVTDRIADVTMNYNAIDTACIDVGSDRYVIRHYNLAKFMLVPFDEGLISMQTYDRYAKIIRDNDRIEYAKDVLSNVLYDAEYENAREYIMSKELENFAYRLEDYLGSTGEDEYDAAMTCIEHRFGGLCTVDLISNKGTDTEIRQRCKIVKPQLDFIKEQLDLDPNDREFTIFTDEDGDNCDLTYVNEVILIEE